MNENLTGRPTTARVGARVSRTVGGGLSTSKRRAVGHRASVQALDRHAHASVDRERTAPRRRCPTPASTERLSYLAAGGRRDRHDLAPRVPDAEAELDRRSDDGASARTQDVDPRRLVQRLPDRVLDVGPDAAHDR